VRKQPIKFNLKLEATYHKVNDENSSENRSFKTSARAIFLESNLDEIIDQAYVKLIEEEEEYVSRGSGFTLQYIDGLILTVYRYWPMIGAGYSNLPARTVNNRNYRGGDIVNRGNDNGDNTGNERDNNSSGGDIVNRGNYNGDNRGNDDGEGDSINRDNNSSGGDRWADDVESDSDNVEAMDDIGGRDQVTRTFISLPSSIKKKMATVNPQYNDGQCFKWSVLAKHVTGHNRSRIGNNYLQHSYKYDFTGLSFPTPLCEVKMFE